MMVTDRYISFPLLNMQYFLPLNCIMFSICELFWCRIPFSLLCDGDCSVCTLVVTTGIAIPQKLCSLPVQLSSCASLQKQIVQTV